MGTDRTTPQEGNISDDESIPDLSTRNNDNISMSNDESTVDSKTVSGNDFNKDTNVNKEIEEAKRITKKEEK